MFSPVFPTAAPNSLLFDFLTSQANKTRNPAQSWYPLEHKQKNHIED